MSLFNEVNRLTGNSLHIWGNDIVWEIDGIDRPFMTTSYFDKHAELIKEDLLTSENRYETYQDWHLLHYNDIEL